MSRKNLFLALLALAGIVNLLSAFGPELGFDALWYHLSLAKLYLLHRSVYHVPGGLLYYSEMPRLTELLYVPLLQFFGETGPHLLSWGAGIGSAVILYKLSRKFLPQATSLLVTTIFYVTPLVGWQSGSAYVDLFRTFFEVLAIHLIFDKKLILAGLAIGLAISTKSLALGSVPVLMFLVYFLYRNLRLVAVFSISAAIVSLPWFISAYLNTGYPLYPIGAAILDYSHKMFPSGLNVIAVFGDLWKLFVFPEDPISPVFIIFLPFLFIPEILAKVLKNKSTIGLIIYCLLGYLSWWITPRTGGGRFILPYLPGFALLCGLIIDYQGNRTIKSLMIAVVFMVATINLGFRTVAVSRLLPYFKGQETKESYLCRNLDFKTNVFVDCDGWFSKNHKPTDLVYVAGVHNLYYIDFPFVHETWYAGQNYNYILTQNSRTTYPGTLVYQNIQTGVKLYKR